MWWCLTNWVSAFLEYIPSYHLVKYSRKYEPFKAILNNLQKKNEFRVLLYNSDTVFPFKL